MTYCMYSPVYVKLFCNETLITGFVEDEIIEVVFDDQRYVEAIDAQGNISRKRVNGESATVIIHLLQSSSSNDVLRNFVEADKLDNSGVFPMIIKDQDDKVLICSTAYISEVPKISCDIEDSTRKWIIRAVKITESKDYSVFFKVRQKCNNLNEVINDIL